MNPSARRIPRNFAVIALVTLVSVAAAGTNLPEGYPAPECGNRPEVPERPEKFETEEAIREYNAKVDAYNQSMERLIECVRAYVANANDDMKQIRKRAEEAIDRLSSQ